MSAANTIEPTRRDAPVRVWFYNVITEAPLRTEWCSVCIRTVEPIKQSYLPGEWSPAFRFKGTCTTSTGSG